jgi:thiamine-phosphate pyrophosphorylase
MLLYYITDRKGFAGSDADQRAALLLRIAEAATAGVDYIQLREKDLSGTDLAGLATLALKVIRDNSPATKLLINTHAGIAHKVGADGVHLPAGSLPASDIRAVWLQETDRVPLIGVSAHDIAEARRAEFTGASFAVLAPIFEKVRFRSEGLGLDTLRKACTLLALPVFALGGVNLANARDCLNAGAAGIAGIRLFQHGDVSRTVNALRDLAPEDASPAN